MVHRHHGTVADRELDAAVGAERLGGGLPAPVLAVGRPTDEEIGHHEAPAERLLPVALGERDQRLERVGVEERERAIVRLLDDRLGRLRGLHLLGAKREHGLTCRGLDHRHPIFGERHDVAVLVDRDRGGPVGGRLVIELAGDSGAGRSAEGCVEHLVAEVSIQRPRIQYDAP